MDDEEQEARPKVRAYVGFRATEATADRLAELAYRADRSVSYVVRKFVEEALDRLDQEEQDHGDPR